MKKFIFLSISILFSFYGFGQKGPGGVTDDNNNSTNCRLWLDASTLNQADGTNVELWEDKSVSLIVDNAFWDSDQDYAPPEFRSDPAAGINGKPTISFENGGMLSIGDWPNEPTSADLNSNPGVQTTYEQSVFIALRTGSDVNSRQVIWEEGGSARGFRICIVNGTIRIGAYDDINDNDPGPSGGQGNGQGVRTFGFTWKQLPVQANTTYVVSLVYNVPTNNVVLNNSTASLTTGINGTLNGEAFPPNMLWGGQEWNQAGVGGVFTHPDPIGIGGINRTSYDENGPIGNNTGANPFTGRISEICYYAYAVSPCQRIIIENYLAAKYFANVIANDKFEYEASYGDGVIGIGKQNNADFHNFSQGDNLFEMSADPFNTAFPSNSPSYILTGHNNNPITWTSNNVPDTLSIRRLRRVWRLDLSGNVSSSPVLDLKIEPSDLPALPAGFLEYGVMIEKSNGLLPNFNEVNSEIVGFRLIDGRYEAEIEVEDGAHLTVVAIKPQIEFKQASAFSVEGDNPPATQPGEIIYVGLNFEPDPTETYSATITLNDDNATYGADYTAVPGQTINVNFTGGVQEWPIPITIVNDNTEIGDDPIERFFAIITSVSSNLTIGQQDTLTYRILDNDPPPTASFQTDNISFNEIDGVYNVPVEIIGSFTGSPQVTVELVQNQGTATPGTDFSIVSPQILTFNSSNAVQNVEFTIIDDDIGGLPYDEFDEWFKLQITNASGVGFNSSVNLETTVNIIDLDPEPEVQFQAATSEGYEAVSDPRVYVELSAPSAKLISIPFRIKECETPIPDPPDPEACGTALPEIDYDASSNATLIIQPGETEGYLYYDIPSGQTRLFIYADGIQEPPETIIFELSDSPGPVHAQLGSQSTHVFTILDYEPFQNTGAAGVAKLNDNTFWMVANEANTGAPSSVPNFSPRNINIIQSNTSRRPVVVEDVLNGKKVLRFNSNQSKYLAVGNPNTLGQSSLINTAGQYDSKSIFFVITPGSSPGPGSSNFQTIYEQGGGARGLSVYIRNGTLYFQAWNVPNDDGNATPNLAPWGHQNSNYAFTESTTTLQSGVTYIVSVHYQNNMLNNAPTNEGLRLYINGVKEDTYTGNVGRLYTHGGRTNIGCSENQSFYSDGPYSSNNPGRCFNGDIAEIIYYNEPNTTTLNRMNEPRIQIIHNYLASKYDITSSSSNLGSNQLFDDNFSDASIASNYFGNELAGVGLDNGESHIDSRGVAELRVSSVNWSGSSGYLVWGHNGESLTNTWPYSQGGSLPSGIQERSGRVWKFFESGAGVNTAQIEIDFSASNNSSDISADKNILRLLVHSNSDPNDFSNAGVYNPAVSQATGNVVRFSDIPVTNGMYIALGNTSTYFNTPLPIELLDFNARLNGPVVDLSWATATEVNNELFVVERAGADLVWDEILTVSGAGNSTSTLYYHDKDRSPLKGISYYRLKQIDYDGTSTTSDLVSIFNPGANLDDKLSLYPNPSLGTSVFLRVPEKAKASSGQITITDISGKTVFQTDVDQLNTIQEVRYGSLPSGIYLVNLNTTLVNESVKLIIQ